MLLIDTNKNNKAGKRKTKCLEWALTFQMGTPRKTSQKVTIK